MRVHQFSCSEKLAKVRCTRLAAIEISEGSAADLYRPRNAALISMRILIESYGNVFDSRKSSNSPIPRMSRISRHWSLVTVELDTATIPTSGKKTADALLEDRSKSSNTLDTF